MLILFFAMTYFFLLQTNPMTISKVLTSCKLVDQIVYCSKMCLLDETPSNTTSYGPT